MLLYCTIIRMKEGDYMFMTYFYNKIELTVPQFLMAFAFGIIIGLIIIYFIIKNS